MASLPRGLSPVTRLSGHQKRSILFCVTGSDSCTETSTENGVGQQATGNVQPLLAGAANQFQFNSMAINSLLLLHNMYLTDTFCHLPTATGIAIFLFLLHISAQNTFSLFYGRLYGTCRLSTGGVAISHRLGAFYLIRAAKWETLIQRLLLSAAEFVWQRICEIKSDYIA